MFTQHFWTATAERAVKTFAQSLLALLSAMQLGILDVDWVTTLSTAGMASLLSVLTSVGGARIGTAEDPSLLAPAPLQPAAQAVQLPLQQSGPRTAAPA
jgi:Putative lactococcus lactis phage r1t holin